MRIEARRGDVEPQAKPGFGAVLDELNEQQRAAVCHGRSPLLIVAGAGTGKTRTLAHRVAWHISQGVEPGRILLLTFTRRASAEMIRRVDGILRRVDDNSSRAVRRVVGGTFHAIGTRMLRRFGKLIGLDPGFTILDRSDSEDLMHVLRHELELAQTGTRFPTKGACVDIYSRCVNAQTRLATVLPKYFPRFAEYEEELKRLFEAYVDAKERHQVLDYDDLLLFWQALVNEPRACAEIRQRFDCVLVDEFQDTNLLQADILKQMCPEGEGLTVVGDDAQSIYSFRSATVRNILDFPEQYPGTTIVTLEQNYRSTQPILEATNRLIAEAAEGHRKQLWSDRESTDRPRIVQCLDEHEQTEFIVETLLEAREKGTALREQAILFRASHHSMALEVELARRNIPFHKYGGLKFIETAHVKDLIGFLRLAENPRDLVAGMRVLMLLPGIGGKRAQQALELLLEGRGQFAIWHEFAPPASCREQWPDFVRLMEHLAVRSASVQSLQTEIHSVRSFYAPLLESKYDHAAARLRDLEQLEQIATRFQDRSEFLSELTLDPPASTQDLAGDPTLDDDYVILSTIHSAKGLEWDNVFVIHAADGNIPSDMATGSPAEIEEERRLMYVALTRARNQLFVCHPQRYYFHNRFRSDSHSYSQLSRFLTGKPCESFDVCQAFAGADDRAEEVLPETDITTADIRRRQRGMWS